MTKSVVKNIRTTEASSEMAKILANTILGKIDDAMHEQWENEIIIFNGMEHMPSMFSEEKDEPTSPTITRSLVAKTTIVVAAKTLETVMEQSTKNSQVMDDILNSQKYWVIPRIMTDYQKEVLRFIEDFPMELTDKFQAIMEAGSIDTGNYAQYIEPDEPEKECGDDCSNCSCQH